MATDRGACAGRTYLERGAPVLVHRGWRGKGPRNVLIERLDGSLIVRPFRGLRKLPEGCGCTPDPDTGELHDRDGWPCCHG